MRYFMTEYSFEGDKPVEGESPHNLPLITCPYCHNFRGVPEVKYPSVDLKLIFDSQTEKRLRRGKARPRGLGARDWSWEEFLAIRQRIRNTIDAKVPLPPGTQFGMYAGKVYARPQMTDLVMPDAVTLLARRKVAERLNELGNNLRLFEIKLKQQKNRIEDLVQVWAPPVAKLGPSAQVSWCEHCERGSMKKTDAIDKSSLPENTHLCVAREGTFSLILSEKLVRDIEASNFSGLNYSPIPCE